MKERYLWLGAALVFLAGCTSIDQTDKRQNPPREGPMALYDVLPPCSDPSFQEGLSGYLPSGMLRQCIGNRFAFYYSIRTPGYSIEFFTPEHRYSIDITSPGRIICEGDFCQPAQYEVSARKYGPDWYEGYAEPMEDDGSLVILQRKDLVPTVTDDDIVRTLKNLDDDTCMFYFHVGSEQAEIKGAGC